MRASTRPPPAAASRSRTTASGSRSALAVLELCGIAGVVAGALAATSGRYGYHRDELYFLACGRHLAWGYPDQPPLVPLLARLMSELPGASVAVLRIPADLAAAATVFITGAIAREFGARRVGQVLAAASIGVSNLLLATGHLLSTTTFLMTCWAALVLIALRALRTGDARWWLAFGAVAGLGLLDSDLVAFLVVAVIAGTIIAGPRRALLSSWAAGGAALALVLWSPYLAWQAAHGWPQLTVAHAIANGGSGTSAPRWEIVVMQVVLASPPLLPLWVCGVFRLLRSPGLAWARALGVAYVALLVAFLVAGGKPYYLGAAFPLLVGAGAPAFEAWMSGRPGRGRAVVVMVALSALPDAVVTLPLLPVSLVHATPIVSMNYDAGETIAWPTYVSEIAQAYRRVPAADRPRTVVLTENYGEAGAVDRYGPMFGLPSAYSGHNAYWLWGPPPAGTTTVVAVGLRPQVLRQLFTSVERAGRLHNDLGIANDEQGVHVWVCTSPAATWPELWPTVKRYG